MKVLLAVNLFLLAMVAAILFVLIDDSRDSAVVLAITVGIAGSGALTAWLLFKRGKVYEKRGESGPDD